MSNFISGLVSVVIPVYKAEPYLRDCVDSVLAQTYPNLEIILVDDGSPDGCYAICDEYAAADHRVRVIHKENSGVSDTRNRGLEVAKGEWITFVDSDDMLAPSMIETLVEACSDCETVAAVVFSRFKNGEMPVSTDASELISCADIPAFTRCRGGLFVWGVLYSHSCIEKLRLRFDISLGNLEDVTWNMCYLGHASKLQYISGSLYHYRQNPTSITSRCCDKLWQVKSWFQARSSIFTWYAQRDLSRIAAEVLPYANRYCVNNIFAECTVGEMKDSDYAAQKIAPAETGVRIPELVLEKWFPRFYFNMYMWLMRLRNRIRSR